LKNDIPVADVREVGAFMSMTSGEGGWRVVIVDSADDMNRNAANALLKVLEEPPPRALLMLISHNPGRLLPTIRSRCRKLALRPLAPELIAAELGTAVPDTDRDRLGRLADGSLGRALDLAADSGLEIHSQLIELLASLPRLDGRALTAFCDRFSRVGTERAFDLLGELLLGLVNRIARSAAGAATAGVDEAESRLIAGLSARAPAETWLTYWEGVTHLLDRTRAVNLDRRHVLMTLMTRLARAAGAP
ncbi:MAG: DNA polymerase III subunit delta', partial [Rhodospirillales bacterium]